MFSIVNLKCAVGCRPPLPSWQHSRRGCHFIIVWWRNTFFRNDRYFIIVRLLFKLSAVHIRSSSKSNGFSENVTRAKKRHIIHRINNDISLFATNEWCSRNSAGTLMVWSMALANVSNQICRCDNEHSKLFVHGINKTEKEPRNAATPFNRATRRETKLMMTR